MGETMGDMMQAELTALRADLLRAVQDRATLMAFRKKVYEMAWIGMDRTSEMVGTGIVTKPGYLIFSEICDEAAKVKYEMEGKK